MGFAKSEPDEIHSGELSEGEDIMASLGAGGLEAEMLPVLVKTFPKAFFAHGRNRRPLRVGIFEELNAALPPEIDRQRLRLYLGIYTRQPSYLRELTPGAIRIDLSGYPAGGVSAKEAASAATRLQKLHDPDIGPQGLKAAEASCPESACSIMPAPPPATTSPAAAVRPRRASNFAQIAEALRQKKAPEAEPQKVIVVLKKNKVSWRAMSHPQNATFGALPQLGSKRVR